MSRTEPDAVQRSGVAAHIELWSVVAPRQRFPRAGCREDGQTRARREGAGGGYMNTFLMPECVGGALNDDWLLPVVRDDDLY